MDAATKDAGSVTIVEVESVQPFASVIVTLYVPAITPVIEAVVAELDHAYVYGIVPPVDEAVAPPFEIPLHVVFESTTLEAINIAGSVIVVELVEVHPFASVMVTLYIPAITPVIDAVVAELLHA
jgi:hypothetical protein